MADYFNVYVNSVCTGLNIIPVDIHVFGGGSGAASLSSFTAFLTSVFLAGVAMMFY